MTDLPETFELVLDRPVKVKGGEIASLTLREPRARHVRDAEKKLDARGSEASVSEYEISLIAACANVDEEAVKALPVRKIGLAMRYLDGFIGDPFRDLDDDPLDDLPDAEFEVEIAPPLTWGGISYPHLPLREPTAEELKKARQFTRQAITPYTVRCREMELLRLVTGLPPAVIDGLRVTTQVEASRQLARFIAAGLRGGRA